MDCFQLCFVAKNLELGNNKSVIGDNLEIEKQRRSNHKIKI